MGDPRNEPALFLADQTVQPTEVLEWALENFYPRIAIASSFSAEDTVIIDMATSIEPNIQVFFIDTGYHFKETEAIKQQITTRYHLNLVEYSGHLSIKEQDLQYGPQLCARDPDLCCQLRKVEPIKRALKDVDAWITGLRREQARTRKNIKVIEYGRPQGERSLTKINPLVYWTKQQVWNYLVDNKLPYNLLYDKGYASIGCEFCTRPIKPGEDERAGRWSGRNKTECGIHTFMKKNLSGNRG